MGSLARPDDLVFVTGGHRLAPAGPAKPCPPKSAKLPCSAASLIVPIVPLAPTGETLISGPVQLPQRGFGSVQPANRPRVVVQVPALEN